MHNKYNDDLDDQNDLNSVPLIQQDNNRQSHSIDVNNNSHSMPEPNNVNEINHRDDVCCMTILSILTCILILATATFCGLWLAESQFSQGVLRLKYQSEH